MPLVENDVVAVDVKLLVPVDEKVVVADVVLDDVAELVWLVVPDVDTEVD